MKIITTGIQIENSVAKTHIAGYAKRLQTIIDNDGDIITKYK